MANKKRILMNKGFTIVELLIVVVVVGILASITIVSYSGIQSQATEAAIKSDVRNGATQLEVDRISSGAYPDDITDYRWSASSEPTYLVNDSNSEYCLEISSAQNSNIVYKISSDSGSIEAGTCPPFVVVVLDAPLNLYAGQGPMSLYVDWRWPLTLTSGTYDMHADLHCQGSYAFITSISELGVSANPGETSPLLSVSRNAISSCSNPIRFTVYYTDPTSGESSPTATISITP